MCSVLKLIKHNLLSQVGPTLEKIRCRVYVDQREKFGKFYFPTLLFSRENTVQISGSLQLPTF